MQKDAKRSWGGASARFIILRGSLFLALILCLFFLIFLYHVCPDLSTPSYDVSSFLRLKRFSSLSRLRFFEPRILYPSVIAACVNWIAGFCDIYCTKGKSMGGGVLMMLGRDEKCTDMSAE
jgi:hypothetical protein